MTEVVAIGTARRMSAVEYERERQELRALYGDNSKEAAAKADQALAVLFYRSGWTQEELAAKEGMGQQWISRRLVFGRFLNFTPMGVNSNLPPNNLSERRFRHFWGLTDGDDNERSRFGQVLRLMAEAAESEKLKRGISDSHRNIRLGDQIVDKFSDGKWHAESRIISETAPEAPLSVKRTLHLMQEKETYSAKCEQKSVKGQTHWRIFPLEKTVSLNELTEKLGPLIEELELEGKKNMATMSPSTVARLTVLLQRQIDEWAK